MKAYPPLPVREAWTPAYLSGRDDANRDFAFGLVDAEGAPSRDGRRYHSAVDWFAPGGTAVRAPGAGTVVRVVPSRGNSGQVFGGVLEVEESSGLVWVMRHVDPAVTLWREVEAGDELASVTHWQDGGPHLHLEIWRSLTGGYVHENMIDPRGVEWSSRVAARPELPRPAAFYFEEGPEYTRSNAARLRYRFGPWGTAAARDRVMAAREANTGRAMRPFKGRAASLYAWPVSG